MFAFCKGTKICVLINSIILALSAEGNIISYLVAHSNSCKESKKKKR